LNNKIPAIAQTNHGNMDGSIRFYKLFNNVGIKPILGCEIYIVPEPTIKEKEKRHHITLLVKNQTGWNNLCKMMSNANTTGFYKRPRVGFDELVNMCEGLIVLSGCPASPFLRYPDLAEKIYDVIGDDLYLEIMPYGNIQIFGDTSKYFDLLNSLKNIHKKLGIKFVATNDVHYILPEDRTLHEVMRCVGFKQRWPERHEFDERGLFIRTREEMEEAFVLTTPIDKHTVCASLDTTMEIVEKISFVLKQQNITIPIHNKYEGINEEELLMFLCSEGLHKRGLFGNTIYENRLCEELSHIIPIFTRYFIVLYDLYDWAKNKSDIFCGIGRGSAAGSLVAYLLGITEIDPIKFNLLFERFIAPGRTDLPDVDMDFEDRRREDVIQYLCDTYGKENVAGVSNFQTNKTKGMIRDVARVFDVPLSETNILTKQIDVDNVSDNKDRLQMFFETDTIGKRYYQQHKHVIDIVLKLSGIVRNCGVHASGVVMNDEKLTQSNKCVIVKRSNQFVVNWDKNDIEQMGLVKYDILGLSTLSVIHEIVDMIKKNHGYNFDFYNIDLNDKNIYDMLSKGLCQGVFQLGASDGIIRVLQELKPQTFDDIVNINALYRPGAMRSDIYKTYIGRKKGEIPIKYIHPLLQPITESTLGCVIYQEQVMYLMHYLAGFDWGTVDKVRKVVAKSKGVEEIMKFKDKFINGCLNKKTLNEKNASDVFDMIKQFGEYSFNKSHAVAYSFLGYVTAWLKYYYTKEFFCCLLNYGTGKNNQEVQNKQLSETEKFGIYTTPPDINTSDIYWSIKDNELVSGLSGLKGIGEKASVAIINERDTNGNFVSFEDFMTRTKRRIVNTGVIRKLVHNNVFHSFGDKNTIKQQFIDMCDTKQKTSDNKVCIEDNGLFETVSFWGEFEEFVIGFKSKFDINKLSDVGNGIFVGMLLQNGAISDGESSVKILNQNIINTKTQEYVVVRGERGKDGIVIESYFTMTDVMQGFGIRELNLNLCRPTNVRVSLSKDNMCNKCPDKNIGGFVPTQNGKFRITIVGEAGGEQEEKEKTPFVGRSGKLLFDIFKEQYNIDRDWFYVANIVGCRPRKNETPSKELRTYCGDFMFSKIIRTISPYVILSLGNTSGVYLSGDEKFKIGQMNGKVMWNTKFKCWIVFGVHPSYVLRNPTENKYLLEKAIVVFLDLFI